MEFVQVRLLPNVVPSVPLEDRSRAADGVIRLLRGEIAVISKESSAVYWMRLRDIVSYAVIANRTILEMERNLQVPLPVIRHIDVPFAVSGNSNDRL